MQRARRGELATEEAGPEPGDFVEPGSVPDSSPLPPGFTGGAASLEQLRGLHASGLIDAETFALIEASMTNATAELDRLHASGVMSDEVYAQAKASMPAASDPSAEAAELELLQRGESAPATVLTVQEADGEAGARLLTELEVHPATGAPYPASCAIAAGRLRSEPKPGDFLRVRIDRDDPTRVAIDWPAFGVGS
jgi:Short C-terminal domain